MPIYHIKNLTIADDPAVVSVGGAVPSDWNAAHSIGIDGTTIHTHSNKAQLDAFVPGNFVSTGATTNFMPAVSSGNFASTNHTHDLSNYAQTTQLSNYAASTHTHIASAISYSNTASQLLATDVQAALDEIVQNDLAQSGHAGVVRVDRADITTNVVSTDAVYVRVASNTCVFVVNGTTTEILNVDGILSDSVDNLLALDAITYVVIQYNNGTPRFWCTTDETTIDYLTILPYAEIYKRTGSSNVHTQLTILRNVGEVEQHSHRVFATERYAVETGMDGLVIEDTSLHITGNAGVVWSGNYRYVMETINSLTTGTNPSPTRQFPCWFSTNNGWQVGTTHTVPVLNTASYNDITNDANTTTPTAIPTGKWGIMYLYRGIENENHVYSIQSFEVYDNEDLAKAAGLPPSLPAIISSHAMFIGRIIFSKDQTTGPFIVESAVGTTFNGAAAVNTHNSLMGLQGGNLVDQYYHINSTANAAVSQIASTADSSLFLNQQGAWTTVGGGGGAAISAGTSSINSGTVHFNDANGISWSMDSLGNISASHNAVTTTGNFISTGATSGYGTNIPKQTISTGATSHVLFGDGRWASVLTATSAYLSTNADTAYAKNSLFAGANISGTLNSTAFSLSVAAPVATTGLAQATTLATSNAITGTINSTTWNIGLNTTANGFTHTHAYLATNSGVQSINGSAAGSAYTIAAGGAVTTASATNGITIGVQTSAFQTTGNYMSTAASNSLAATTALATSNAITGTINSTTWNIGLNTTANGFTHTHAYQAAGNYASTYAFTGTNITGTIGANSASMSVAAGAVGTQYATQSVSTAVSSHVLYGDGGWRSVQGGVGGGIGSINGQTADAQTITFAGGVTGTSATNGITFDVATSYSTQFIPAAGSSSFGRQTAAPSQSTGASSVLANNGAWVTVATSQSSQANVAYTTQFNATSAITGTINSTQWSIGLNTSANGFTHTHNYQATGNYASTNFSGFAPQTTTATASSLFLAGNGAWTTVGGGGTQYATQSVSTAVSSHVLYGDGRWASVAGGNQTINNSGVLGVGLSASSTNIATGGSIYYQGNNITIDMTTNANGSHTMNFSAATAGGGGGVTLDGVDYPRHWKMATSGSTLITTQVHMKHLELQNNCRVSALDWPISIAVASMTNTTSQSVTINASVVFYTMNAGTLSPFLGGTFTTGTTFASASTGSIAGARMLHIPLASTTLLTPNDYWVGYQMQLAGFASTTVTNHIASGSVPSLYMEFAGLSVTTTNRGGILEPQGMIAASMSNTTNTWNSTAINMGAASWYRANIPVIIRNQAY